MVSWRRRIKEIFAIKTSVDGGSVIKAPPSASVLRSLCTRILTFVFRMVKAPPSFEQVTHNLDSIVVVTPSRSIIIEGLLLSLCRKKNIRTVRYATQSDGTKTAPAPQPSLRWISMHDARSISYLLQNEADLRLVTFNIFQVKGPVRNPPQRQPGIIWHLGIVLARRLLTVVFGQPFRPPEHSPSRLMRALKVDFYRNLKIVRGTPFQNVDVQADIALAGADFEREIRILAERANEPLARYRARARAAFFEMAANPRRPMYSILAVISRFIIRRLFTEVVTHGLDRLVPAIREHPVVLVPMHRSHLDYIIIGYKLYEANVNPPLVAAGINLSFWPIGFIIRSVGSYFVKRNSRDRLHALVLRRYITYLVKRGHLQEFFIEGGRSRSGKMMQPKLGILNILVDAWKHGLRRDVLFVPVSVSYENVIEDESFGEENTGRSKQRETLLGLIRALDIFHRRYGEVVIHFGAPLALSDCLRHLRQEEAPGADMRRRDLRLVGRERAEGRTPSLEQKRPASERANEKSSIQELALTLTRAIRQQINPSLTSLTCTALLSAPRYGLGRSELIESIFGLSAYLEKLRLRNEVASFTPALQRFIESRDPPGMENGRGNFPITSLALGGIVQVVPYLDGHAYYIPGKRRFTADFYRNATLHLFLPLGLYALLDLMGRGLDVESAMEFYPLFAHDLMLTDPLRYRQELAAGLDVLKAVDALELREGRWRFRSQSHPLFIPGLTMGFVESLLWVHLNLRGSSARIEDSDLGPPEPSRVFSYTEFFATLQREFRVASYIGSVTRTEASSKSALQAALDSLLARQVIVLQDGSSKNGKIVVRQDTSGEIKLLSDIVLAFRQWSSVRGYSLCRETPEHMAAAIERRGE